MKDYKLHVVGLPHTKVNADYNICAYTGKLLKFQKMFPDEHYYFNEGSNGKYTQIYSNSDMNELFGHYDWYKKNEIYKVEYDSTLPYWIRFNTKVIEDMRKVIQPHDIICNIGGRVQKVISDAFPNNITCEFGVGYEGVFSNYRVFESYAWMHSVYGYLYTASRADGHFFDAVIPNYFDIGDFPYSDKKDDYFLFMSRPIDRKGTQIVRDLIKYAGIKVKVAGREKPDFGEWVGPADTKLRGDLMSHARALLCPTLYIEPFGGVGVEAQLCGTPVITTDWGAFPETVEQGKTGLRCKMLKEFIEATHKTDWNYKYIRNRAISLYSLEAVKPQYEKYFTQLQTLFKKGWYEI
jgi:glycosyltransferase involved in cell wall biosynthesis